MNYILLESYSNFIIPTTTDFFSSNEKENYSNTEFFNIDLSEICAGLNHQRSNLISILRYCYKHNLKLIKPIFRLYKLHNNGIEIKSDLSSYFDLDHILVNNKIVILYDSSPNQSFTISKKKYKYGLLCNDPLFIENENIPVSIPYHNTIKKIAEKIVQSFDNNFMCVHIRRGDRITSNQMNVDTSPDHILSIIKKQSITKQIYIMTNKIDEVVSLQDNKDYTIYFYKDFPVLTAITDNFYLYCVENVIMELATVRCSTFNTGNTLFYQYYLTDTTGWV